MISHDLKSVYDIADYVSLLRDGRIELSAPRAAFFASDNVYVRAFLDASNVVFSETTKLLPAKDKDRTA
ncbi:MAG: hypothetical protein JWN04_6365 [Myxococcaceae bacterium]|nr:hypothetical protein [Myxococcaceae bacterium]